MYLVCFENMMYQLVRLGLVDIVNVDVHDLEASDQEHIQDFFCLQAKQLRPPPP